jgi:hypothetical protein
MRTCGQRICPHHEGVDSPCGVHALTTLGIDALHGDGLTPIGYRPHCACHSHFFAPKESKTKPKLQKPTIHSALWSAGQNN